MLEDPATAEIRRAISTVSSSRYQAATALIDSASKFLNGEKIDPDAAILLLQDAIDLIRKKDALNPKPKVMRDAR